MGCGCLVSDDAPETVAEEETGDRPSWATSDRDYEYTEVHGDILMLVTR
jgi:hypothetical protein